MQYVNLGRSNLKVSRLGLGAMGIGDKSWRSWVLDEEAASPILKRALELGINFIDTCDYYSSGRSEEVVGRLLRSFTRREEIVLATKVGNPMGQGPNARGFSRKHLNAAVNQSLRRLQTDYIDLYQTHIWDPSTHIEEMVDALDALVRAGKVLYLGITDMPTWQLAKAYYYASYNGRSRFISVQNHYNAIWREDERELIPFAGPKASASSPIVQWRAAFWPAAHGAMVPARPSGCAAMTTRTRSMADPMISSLPKPSRKSLRHAGLHRPRRRLPGRCRGLA